MASQAPCRASALPFGDDEALLDAFRADGLAVVEGVLSETEVESALEELWSSPRLLARSGCVRRDDPSTWGAESWPQQDGGRNFLESVDPFEDRAGWELAQHPRVLHVLRLLYGGPVFAGDSTRWGVMRPTAEHPEWRTDESWLHWDQNPWSQPAFARVQCFLCLSDQTPSSGGFLCVPGFQHRWRDWGEAHPEGSVQVAGRTITRDYGDGMPFPVPEDDPAHGEVVRILAPRGSLVLWDGRLPHQNYPNTGTKFRVVHYLHFAPLDPSMMAERQEVLRKRLAVRRALGRGAGAFFPDGLSELGREVLCVPPQDSVEEELDPSLQRAILLTVEAGEDELRGDLKASVEKLRTASKTRPGIEEWHGAIFGS